LLKRHLNSTDTSVEFKWPSRHRLWSAFHCKQLYLISNFKLTPSPNIWNSLLPLNRDFKQSCEHSLECTAWQCRLSIVCRPILTQLQNFLFSVPTIFLMLAIHRTLLWSWHS